MKALGRIISLLFFALLAGPLVAGAADTSQAAITPGTRGADALPGLIREAEKGVFFIRVLDADGKLVATGTGFLLEAKGSVLTSLHVIRPLTGCAASAVALAANGKPCVVTGVTVGDESLDLALLQLAEVPPDAVPMVLAGNELPERGTHVIVLGHPKEFRFVATDGILSAVNKTSELSATFSESDSSHAGADVVWLQTSAAVATGNSGGPMLDASGKVIGVIQAMGRGAGMNFALHVASVREFLTRPAALLSVEEFARAETELKQLMKKFQTDYQQYQQAGRPAASPATQGEERPAAPVHPGAACLAKMLALADANRGKDVEFRALEMLLKIACMRDFPPEAGAAMQQAADRLLTDFRDDRRMLAFLRGIPAPTLPQARGFLRALTEQSADAGIRSLAALAVALTLESGMNSGAPPEEAMKFARVAAACPAAIMLGSEPVATMAARLVDRLTHCSVGCPAPGLAGMDRKGQALELGDFLGRYVVVAFWNKKADFFDTVAGTLDELERKYAGAPLSLIGVGLYNPQYPTSNEAKATNLTWRSIADGPDESLKKAWHVTAMPTLFLLDPKGLIIGRFADGPALSSMTSGSGSMAMPIDNFGAGTWKAALTNALKDQIPPSPRK